MQDNVSSTKNKIVSSKGLDIIISSVFMLIFFLCPLFFTGYIAQGIGFEKMMIFYVLTLLGVVAWVTKGVVVGELNLKRTPLDLPILSVLLVFSISTIFSVSSVDSLIGNYGSSAKSLIAAFAFALFYYLLVNNINAQKIKYIFVSFLTGSFFVILYSFLQLKSKFILPLDFTHNLSFNPIGSLSGLTAFLVIIFPILIVAATKIDAIFPKLNKGILIGIKIFLALVSMLNVYILFMLSGFTVWVFAVIGMVIPLMFFLAKIIKVNNNNLIFPLLGFLVTIIFLILGNFNFSKLDLPAEVSISREASWNIAKNSLKENPIFGSGPSTFYYSFSKFKGNDFNNSPLWNVRFDSPSGALFELLATVGVVGALTVIIVALISFSIIFLSLIKNTNQELNSILLGFFASFFSAGLFSIFFSQNNSLILMIMLITILAVSIAVTIYPEKFSTLKLSFRSSAKYALALSAIFLFVSAGVVVLCTLGFKMYLADVYAKDAILNSDVNKKIEKLEKAKILFPYRDNYALSLANAYMAQANKYALNKEENNKIAEALSFAIENGKDAIEVSPNKVANNESLALIYENASFYTRDALDHAENYYKKVIELDPSNPTPYLRIALINMARANAEEEEEEKKYFIEQAVKKYDEAIQKKEDLAAAFYGKSIAHEKLGEVDDAIEELKHATMYSSDNLDYRFELGRLFFNRGISKFELSQSASKDITENDIDPNNENNNALSVNKTKGDNDVVEVNSDLLSAEQLFLSIVNKNSKHANARYSLAVLYQKTGNNDQAKSQVNTLLDIVQDDATKNAIRTQFSGLID